MDHTRERTLVVDLDGTLIRTDLLAETLFAFLSRRPQQAWRVIPAAAKGRLALKSFLASRVRIEPGTLPYNEDVVAYVKKEKAAGAKVVLASASHATYVKAVAEHLGYVDACHGSETENLKGSAKLRLIKQTYGENIEYIGDSMADLPIWKALGKAFVVNPCNGMLRALQKSGIPVEVVSRRDKSKARMILKALRPHQWSKNFLVLVPFLAAHKFTSPEAWTNAAIATLAFCFVASAVYVLNDLVDINTDRAHPENRKRPFASGHLSLQWGFLLIPLLLGVSGLLSAMLTVTFRSTLATYFVANILYSFKLKRVHSLDLVMLAGMYTARLVAGGEATASRITPWLAAFSVFFFFGLAAVKRFSEISTMMQRRTRGRGYCQDDKWPVLVLGMGSSLLSSLVLALYINSPQISKLYSHPTRLWLLQPILLYWISRIWIATGRGEVTSDPVLYAIKSKETYLVGLLGIVCLGIAI